MSEAKASGVRCYRMAGSADDGSRWVVGPDYIIWRYRATSTPMWGDSVYTIEEFAREIALGVYEPCEMVSDRLPIRFAALSGVRIVGDPEGAVRELVEAAERYLRLPAGEDPYIAATDLKAALARFEVEGGGK